ncbi:hypothetical protein MY11210_000627 [Beauveria gryllotalpidicola]
MLLLASLPPCEAGRDQEIAAWRETCPLASLLSHHRCDEVNSADDDGQETLQLCGDDDLVQTLAAGQQATGAGVRDTAAAGSAAQWTRPRRRGEPQQRPAAEEGIKKLKEAGCISKGEREQKRLKEAGGISNGERGQKRGGDEQTTCVNHQVLSS